VRLWRPRRPFSSDPSTPGVGYGPSGKGYVRLSLTVPDDRLEEAVRRLEGWRG
jgi:aspartate/methionine/tyrosine aminotransferase